MSLLLFIGLTNITQHISLVSLNDPQFTISSQEIRSRSPILFLLYFPRVPFAHFFGLNQQVNGLFRLQGIRLRLFLLNTFHIIEYVDQGSNDKEALGHNSNEVEEDLKGKAYFEEK